MTITKQEILLYLLLQQNCFAILTFFIDKEQTNKQKYIIFLEKSIRNE